jgi:ABC-type transport system substrate-binding protein
MDSLFGSDWTANPSVQNYQLTYYDETYVTGDLASSWEFTSPGVLTIHVRHGVYWQNLPPVNGRQLNSADVLFHMNRMAGLGSGYTAPNSYFVSDAWVAAIKTVTAPDAWTVVMTFSTLNPELSWKTWRRWVAIAQLKTPKLSRHIPRRPTRNSLTGIMPSAPGHLY